MSYDHTQIVKNSIHNFTYHLLPPFRILSNQNPSQHKAVMQHRTRGHLIGRFAPIAKRSQKRHFVASETTSRLTSWPITTSDRSVESEHRICTPNSKITIFRASTNSYTPFPGFLSLLSLHPRVSPVTIQSRVRSHSLIQKTDLLPPRLRRKQANRESYPLSPGTVLSINCKSPRT